jgi:predicted extracellular nuclease
LNDRSRILLDDAQTAQNPDPVIYPSPYLSATNTLRTGYTIDNLTGILDQRFGEYRVQPLDSVDLNPANPRPELPQEVIGTMKVASANVLNYFTTLDDGGDDCGPITDLQECRGANTLFEFDRQRTKIITGLAEINADVVGLIELENNASASLQDLVDGLNAILGADTYTYIDTGFIGTDAIKVGILYKPATVAPVGNYAILDSTVDPTFIDTLNRPALAQTFEENAGSERFTVAINHLKSKGSDCNEVGDPDSGDGQGNCNGTRTAAAAALVNWLGTDPTGNGDSDFLIIGDLNSYAMEEPIATIKNAGYTDLLAHFGGTGAYSYVFDGQSGYLDHALASASLLNQMTGATEWHVNADEPIVLDYNVEFKSAAQVDYFYTPAPYRFSDHDPLVIGLDLHPETSEEPTGEPTEEPTEGATEEPAAVGGEKGAPAGLPSTGAPMPSFATIFAVVIAVVAALAGGISLRRRRD